MKKEYKNGKECINSIEMDKYILNEIANKIEFHERKELSKILKMDIFEDIVKLRLSKLQTRDDVLMCKKLKYLDLHNSDIFDGIDLIYKNLVYLNCNSSVKICENKKICK